jgi:ABC-type iron transport system FetAB ATPase subunit
VINLTARAISVEMRDAEARLAVFEALTGLPWLVKNRRVVPRAVEIALRRLGRSSERIRRTELSPGPGQRVQTVRNSSRNTDILKLGHSVYTIGINGAAWKTSCRRALPA